MKKTIKIFLAAVIMTALFTNCKKEAGPKGDTGAQGPAGPQGNANVITGTVSVSNWTWDGTNKYYTSTIIDAGITQSILDNGVVLVSVVQAGAVLPLPITVYPTSTYGRNYSFIYGLAQIVLRIQDSDLIQSANPGTLVFKVTKIAGSVKLANPHIDWNNPNEVAKFLE